MLSRRLRFQPGPIATAVASIAVIVLVLNGGMAIAAGDLVEPGDSSQTETGESSMISLDSAIKSTMHGQAVRIDADPEIQVPNANLILPGSKNARVYPVAEPAVVLPLLAILMMMVLWRRRRQTTELAH